MSDDVTVRLTEDGPVRIRGNGQSWERGETRTVDADHADALVEAHGAAVEIIDEGPETCDVVKSDGDVCGRDLPCQYHPEG